jgi:predicted secreted Zn-dependent protease
LVASLACAGGKAKAVATGPTPVPGERVRLHTNSSTKAYPVKGSTSETIFDYIERNGPTDDSGQRGSGLTAAKWSYVWKGSASREGCGIASLTVSLDLTVTLPKHEAPQSLTPSVSRSWERFAADVGSHEQHHVDIYMAGAQTMKGLMQAIQPKASCDLLEKEIGAVWSREQKAIDDLQEVFHKDEDTRLSASRRPLQTQIETNRGRLNAMNSQIKAMDEQIDSLRKQIKEAQDLITPLKSQMESIEGAYGSNVPPTIFARYENLRSQYNALIGRYNSLVEQHNSLLDQRSKVAADYERLISTTNDLVDTFNWTR